MALWLLLLLCTAYHNVNGSIRIKINGSTLINPQTDKEILFKGMNWYLPVIEPNDTNIMQSLIPSANIVRLQGLYWDNWNDNDPRDCQTYNASQTHLIYHETYP